MTTPSPLVKPSHRAIKTYYQTLQRYAGQDVTHETAVRSAFQSLLADAAKRRRWTLVPELASEGRGRARVVPDGTVRDEFLIPRGYWEAKDTDDDLDAEIAKKIARGYPLTNIIFEDTRAGVLYQDGHETLRVDLADKAQLADLLNAFLTYAEPNIDEFEKAVDEFKERVPELAYGLTEKIRQAHRDNQPFIDAFARFFEVCQTSLNPNLSQDAVDEMLVQHLLTERLFRTIFDDSDFTRRNVIAAEVERVIGALVSKSFNRHEFLQSLDRFYVAIEDAARGIEDFTDKQHFLNTVYERFFQGYSVKVADTHGIVYTPQPIVDFMCASVAEVLDAEFGKPLGSPGVHILDPCTGTGNFIVNLLRRIPKRHLPRMYREQLFANEVMLLPYYIASLNIEHAYYELTGQYGPFEGLCFVDSLDMAEHAQGEFGFMTEANTARVERQKGAPITVILGNPPYNVGQLNENDNNKNRRYKVVDNRIHDTYAADSTATNKNALSDAYVKFFRWATDRLEDRDGIVCFVSNNSFVDQLAFDGMRKHLLDDFTHLFHVDLHGNVRKNPKLSGTTHNVFGIQVGVGITVAVRKREGEAPSEPQLRYHRVPESWRKEEKLGMLHENARASGVPWQELTPNADHTWLVPEGADQFATLMPIGTKAAKSANEDDVETLFKTYGRGVATCRDDVVYDFQRNALEDRVRQFIEDYNAEVDRWKRTPEKPGVDDFVRYDKVNWSESLKANLARGHYASYESAAVRESLYRPFTKRHMFFDAFLNERRYQFPRIFPTPETEQENRVMGFTDAGSEKPFMALFAAGIIDLHGVGAGSSCQCFPFYVYDEDGSNRRENITDSALAQFRARYCTDPTAGTACTAGILPAFPEASAECRQDAGGTARSRQDAGGTAEGSGAEDMGAPHQIDDIHLADVAVRTRGKLPHWESEDAIYAVTFRLGDSLPRHVLAELEEERKRRLEEIEKGEGKIPKGFEKEIAYAMSERVSEYLDQGAGSCSLSDPRVAGMVRDALLFFEGVRYRLHAWCIMPNHVHLILRLMPGWPLQKVLHSLKSFTAKKANKILGKKGKFWQREYYDRIIRDEAEYGRQMAYVLGNPETVGLRDWPWVGMGEIMGSRQDAGDTQHRTAGVPPAPGCTAGILPAPGCTAGILPALPDGPEDHTITKWDLFYYVYGLLHHPGYREKYGDCLKRELPRIPFAPDFRAFADAGRELADWHLNYDRINETREGERTREPMAHPANSGSRVRSPSQAQPMAHPANSGSRGRSASQVQPGDVYPLKYEVAPDKPLSYRVEDKMRLSKDKASLKVNDTLTLVGIPPETYDYRLGNRSALDWVIDQYRVRTDKRSGITADPNRADDPEYIVRLVGQVIRVSLETVRIVKALPEDFGG